jgi:sulfide dehydrogenase cytochrome subunit
MTAVSRDLSSSEIEAVAEHYAKQTWQPQAQPYDAQLARRGAQIHDLKCDRCHSAFGSEPADDLAILAGQWRAYLETEFADFDNGSRRMADKMKTQYDTLSAADKRALIELYVRGGPPANNN